MDNGFKNYLQDQAATLSLDASISGSEAEKKASRYLMVLAKITDARHILGEEKIKSTSVQSATFAEILSKQTGKTVTENKMNSEAAPEYIKAREDLESLENDLSYLKAYYDIFNNAHVFYRQVAKGEAF